MKVLFAADGSDKQQTAAKTLLALGPPDDTQITVISVIEPVQFLFTPHLAPPYHAEWLQEERRMERASRRFAHLVVELCSKPLRAASLDASSMVRKGQPSEEIVRTAEETQADIVVVGSRGLTGVRLFLLGSVAQKVVEYAPCSVLVVKPLDEPGPVAVRRVLLATDGSQYACAAAKLLSAFRLVTSTEIIVLNVQSTPRWLSDRRHLEDAKRGNAEQAIENTLRCLTTEAEASVITREGDPSEQIISAASEIVADLIVVGSRGLSGAKRFLLGSVSQKVCAYSDRPVMVVRERGL